MYLQITDTDHDRYGETGRLIEKPPTRAGAEVPSIRIDAAIFQIEFDDGSKTTALSSQIQVVPFEWRDLSA